MKKSVFKGSHSTYSSSIYFVFCLFSSFLPFFLSVLWGVQPKVGGKRQYKASVLEWNWWLRMWSSLITCLLYHKVEHFELMMKPICRGVAKAWQIVACTVVFLLLCVIKICISSSALFFFFFCIKDYHYQNPSNNLPRVKFSGICIHQKIHWNINESEKCGWNAFLFFIIINAMNGIFKYAISAKMWILRGFNHAMKDNEALSINSIFITFAFSSSSSFNPIPIYMHVYNRSTQHKFHRS